MSRWGPVKYPIDVENLGSGIPRAIVLGLVCSLTGGLIGILEAVVGYLPGLGLVVMVPAGAIAGSVIGGVLGLMLCYLLFARRLTNHVFYTVAEVAASVGVFSAIVFRLLTGGEGAWLALHPTMVATIIAAVWLRIRK